MLETTSLFITHYLTHPGWEIEIFGNTAAQYALAMVIFVLAAIVFAVFQYIILNRLHALAARTKTDLDETLVAIVRGVRPGFYLFLAAYMAIQTITLAPLVMQVTTAILLVWVAVQAVLAFHKLIDYFLESRSRGEKDKGAAAAYTFIGTIGKWALWAIAVLMVLANFGVNITSLIAGLGIAGVAIGFALQSILSDLFSSFAIYFDKPFEVGDFIVLGEVVGTVERIGIKTTRIRALQGEEIVVSNQDLTGSRIQNFRKLNKRRIVFEFGVQYETPRKSVEKIPDMVKKVADGLEQVELDRAHLKSFGDSSLIFEVVYFVLTDDYNVYMDVQQSINLALMERFEREGIEFAYPTRTVYMKTVSPEISPLPTQKKQYAKK